MHGICMAYAFCMHNHLEHELRLAGDGYPAMEL
jgi:hypothetical protein